MFLSFLHNVEGFEYLFEKKNKTAESEFLLCFNLMILQHGCR